jgi:hypothetical protein
MNAMESRIEKLERENQELRQAVEEIRRSIAK